MCCASHKYTVIANGTLPEKGKRGLYSNTRLSTMKQKHMHDQPRNKSWRYCCFLQITHSAPRKLVLMEPVTTTLNTAMVCQTVETAPMSPTAVSGPEHLSILTSVNSMKSDTTLCFVWFQQHSIAPVIISSVLTASVSFNPWCATTGTTVGTTATSRAAVRTLMG